MIAPLRRRHRLMVSLLALVLPAMLWLAVTARERVPIMAVEALPRGAPPEFADRAGVAAQLSMGTLEQAPDGPTLLIEVHDDPPLPRALLYWRAGEGDKTLRFVDVAQPGVARVTLPAEANTMWGTLVLWDVARGEQLGALPLPAAEDAR